MNWKKKSKNIPARVQIAPKVAYEIVWQKDLQDTKGNVIYGLTDLNTKTITIRMDMKPKLTVETYIHECFHAFSEEFNLGLTENQVLGMENMIPYLDGLFEKGSK